VLGITLFLFRDNFSPKGEEGNNIDLNQEESATPALDQEKLSDDNAMKNEIFYPPIDNARERITKKPFGIEISPASSPVQPERFSGFHTGIDFETFESEANTGVNIYAICDGEVIYKNSVNGYGGAVVGLCESENKPITVLYGHLALSSIGYNIGDKLTTGNKIGILGKSFSRETDGERKHLHIGIHLGQDIDFRGYVQTRAELSNWIDIVKYLQN
jgi:hypothetical protein